MNLIESAIELINHTWEEKCHEFIEMVQNEEEYENHVLYHALNVELHLKGSIEVPDDGEIMTFHSMDALIEWASGGEVTEELALEDDSPENLDDVEAFIAHHCDR